MSVCHVAAASEEEEKHARFPLSSLPRPVHSVVAAAIMCKLGQRVLDSNFNPIANDITLPKKGREERGSLWSVEGANKCNARFYPIFAPLSVREVGYD